MKKTLLLTLALGVAGMSSLSAATVDVYLTGSTAFRASCFTACTNLFVGGPAIYYGDSSHGGANSGFSAKTASWAMSGTPVSTLTNLSGSTLVVHGLFTGSIQGIQTVEQETLLTFAQASGTINGNADSYISHAPTIGFSDASGGVSPFPATGNYLEENVCVQPFVFVKSMSVNSIMTNINNVTWEQAEYGIPAGRIPLAAWTYKDADTNTFIYMLQRTKDSGTRRCETAGAYYQYNDPVGVYIYDFTNNFWYTPTVTATTAFGSSPNGVVGPAGLGSVNLNWGFGYVGGGDIANSLTNLNSANTAISYLSFGDAKGIGSLNGNTTNWGTVLSYNGVWPTATNSAIHGGTGTNDFSPITKGYYPLWGFEVLVHPIVPNNAKQNISQTQLGNQNTPGSFLGVFNSQTAYNTSLAGVPIVGSIEREIEISKPGGATAIRLYDMLQQRPTPGATIYPPFQ
jgi:hypothetical protein